MDQVQTFVLLAPVLLFSMVAHEYAHGYAALTQGDDTALRLGRLTWNPLRHIDPFMTVLLPIMTFVAGGFIFGGAKPVPVVPGKFRNFERGDIIVSLAGVAANAVLVVLFTLLIIPAGIIGASMESLAGVAAAAQRMLWLGIFFNLILIFFNLLPIPPLDGSHVFKYLLPVAWRPRYEQVGRYGILILLFLLVAGGDILNTWMSPIYSVMRQVLRIVASYLLPGVVQ